MPGTPDPSPTYDFGGKVAIVTGAASGMGRATSLAFARAGASILMADIDEAGGATTAAEVDEAGAKAEFVRTDVSRAADVEAMVDAAVDHFGRLDFAVNNAAVGPEVTPLVDLDEAGYDRQLTINLKSVFLGLKYELRQLVAQGEGGSIVNISSVNALRPQVQQSAYNAAKAGVVALTKTAAIEYAGAGIRVNAIYPGAIDTPMLGGAVDEYGLDPAQVAKRLSLLGRFGQPAEIAQAVLWLCSDLSSFTLGHALAVDGGYLAR
jgi:glucose 1-dehydrogenase